MKCPYCKSKTKVVDTRDQSYSRARVWVRHNIKPMRDHGEMEYRWRKRVCGSCNEISYSIEYNSEDLQKIIRDDNDKKD